MYIYTYIYIYIYYYEIPKQRFCYVTGVSSTVALFRRLWQSDGIIEQETFFIYTEEVDFLSSVQRWFLREYSKLFF